MRNKNCLASYLGNVVNYYVLIALKSSCLAGVQAASLAADALFPAQLFLLCWVTDASGNYMLYFPRTRDIPNSLICHPSQFG